MKLTAEKFLSKVLLLEPADFSEKQSYNWFLKFVNSADEEMLVSLLQFITGHRSIPPGACLTKSALSTCLMMTLLHCLSRLHA